MRLAIAQSQEEKEEKARKEAEEAERKALAAAQERAKAKKRARLEKERLAKEEKDRREVAVNSEQALQVLTDKWGAKDYDMKGPATTISLGLDKSSFVSLPIEAVSVVTLQKLSLYECKQLQTLPPGVRWSSITSILNHSFSK